MCADLAVGRLRVVHLVYPNDELFHTKGVGQQGVFAGLPILRYAGLELSSTRRHNQHGTVRLQMKQIKLPSTGLTTGMPHI